MKTGLSWDQPWNEALTAAGAIVAFAAFVVHILVVRKHLRDLKNAKGELAAQQRGQPNRIAIATFARTNNYGQESDGYQRGRNSSGHLSDVEEANYHAPGPEQSPLSHRSYKAPCGGDSVAGSLFVWPIAFAVAVFWMQSASDWRTPLGTYIFGRGAIRLLLLHKPRPLLWSLSVVIGLAVTGWIL